ncbi:hypothetical protein [Nocardia donostiensis]|uniref:hypothetical protein n=1 Tax=Nocardia donostiensis TaxID=1538463 RepID=UPI001C375840|nr:hypothetical protein [Nocardia donostiensis]
MTEWLLWFLDALHHAIAHTEITIDTVLAKTRLNRILDGFNGKLTTRKWAIITKYSQDTALCDINELVELGALRRSASGGRSTSYELVPG